MAAYSGHYSGQQELKTIRVVMVGKTGAGKSSLGNTLLGNNSFVSQGSFHSVTNICQWNTGQRFGINLQVTDTPGISDTERSEAEVFKEIAKSIAVAAPGPHVIQMVIKFGRFTKEEHDAYLVLKELFGKDFTKFVLLVFTGADDMVGDTPEERNEWFRTHLYSAPDTLKSVLQDVEWRYFTISNKDPRPQRDEQARRLTQEMKVLILRNGSTHFSDPLFRDMNAHVDRMVRRRMQRDRVPYEVAATSTRIAIIRNEEEPGFFQKYGEKIKKLLVAAAVVVVGVVGVAVAVATRCSVM